MGAGFRKKIEKRTYELKRSEEKYRNLVENSLEGIFILKNNNLIFANHRLEQITGHSVAEMQSLSSIFDLVVIEDRNKILENFSKTQTKKLH